MSGQAESHPSRLIGTFKNPRFLIFSDTGNPGFPTPSSVRLSTPYYC